MMKLKIRMEVMHMSVSDSLKYDFDYKNEILSGCFDEVDPFTFYETVFSDKDIYTDTCIVSYGSNEKMPLVKSNPIEKTTKVLTIEEMITSSVEYGNVYVAQVAFGANDAQVIKAMNEAEAFDGPSIIIAYSHCIAQGFNLADGLQHQKNAVETGSWPLFRYNPENIKEGKAPLTLDSKAPSKPLSDYMSNETRFQVVNKMNPERYETLLNKAQENVKEKRSLYEHMAEFAIKEGAE